MRLLLVCHEIETVLPPPVIHTSEVNPLNYMLRQCTREDYVVFKLDIDTPMIEIPLAAATIENEGVRALIDVYHPLP